MKMIMLLAVPAMALSVTFGGDRLMAVSSGDAEVRVPPAAAPLKMAADADLRHLAEIDGDIDTFTEDERAKAALLEQLLLGNPTDRPDARAAATS